MREIKYIVVHCTATSPNATVKAIQDFWERPKSQGGMGWKNPGYHFIVEKEGKSHQLAPLESITNGVAGHNSYSIHICYIGGKLPNGKFGDTRTERQKEVMRGLLTMLRTKYPKAKILGHRDLSPDLNGNGIIEPHEWTKECPCFNAIPEYQDI